MLAGSYRKLKIRKRETSTGLLGGQRNRRPWEGVTPSHILALPRRPESPDQENHVHLNAPLPNNCSPEPRARVHVNKSYLPNTRLQKAEVKWRIHMAQPEGPKRELKFLGEGLKIDQLCVKPCGVRTGTKGGEGLPTRMLINPHCESHETTQIIDQN